MASPIVILFVTVCLGVRGDAGCEEFGIEEFTGVQAMQECVKALEAEVQVSEREGTLQTWRCVEVTDNSEPVGV